MEMGGTFYTEKTFFLNSVTMPRDQVTVSITFVISDSTYQLQSVVGPLRKAQIG